MDAILKILVTSPFYFLSILKLRFVVVFILVFAGFLTSVEQISLFFRGGEIFVVSDISIQNFVWISIFFIILLKLILVGGFRSVVYERWVVYHFLFIGYCAFALIWAESTFNAIRDLLQMSFPFFVSILCLLVVREDRDWKTMMASLWIGLGVIVILSLFTFLGGRPLFGVDYGGAERFWGPMGWSALGYYLLPFCTLSFYAVLSRGLVRDYVVFAIVLFVFLITLGRLAMISLFIAICLVYFLWGGSKGRKLKLGIVGAVLGLAALAFILPSIVERTFGYYGEFQWSGRTNSASYVSSRVDGSMLNMIFGYGAGTARFISEELIGIASGVRSRYFVIYTDYGFVGLSLYLLFLGSLLVSSVRLYFQNSVAENGAYSYLSQALVLRLACCIFVIVIGAFDNLTFIYITSLYYLFFAASSHTTSRSQV